MDNKLDFVKSLPLTLDISLFIGSFVNSFSSASNPASFMNLKILFSAVNTSLTFVYLYILITNFV